MRYASALVLLAACSFDPPSGSTGSGATAPDGSVGVSTVKLTVVSSGPAGAGDIASTDHAIACAPGSTQACAASYPAGTEVTLAASVGTGFAADVDWPGCTSTSATCTFALIDDTVIDATFATALFQLTVDASNHGTVMSSDGKIECGATCTHDYAYQTTVTLTAMPNDNFEFDHWSGGPCDSVESSTCTITMQAAAATIAANYQNQD